MEVALRILTWTWLFHACKESHAWSDARFRARFLATLYLHCEYTQRHLEFTDVNSNHYVANAAGLVFGGLFFGAGVQPQRWAKLGWDILCSELPRQVAADGVDFEGSVPYHRLVLELFLLPARFRLACGLDVEWAYSQRVGAMAEFSRTYTRDDGSSPLLGDADDGRALPLGGQPIGDHSYLLPLFERTFGPESAVPSGQAWTELLWHLGPTAVQQPYSAPQTVCSRAFREGGIYVMRNSVDHVFIDCAPVGLAGRGGHGHNDCLSFEAALDGAHLISDCGSYVYTADYDARNRFRATAAHNTPQIDGEEMNRFLTRAYLFNLRYDAVPEVLQWASGPAHDIFCGTHSGYCRLEEGLRPIRTITLEHATHTLTIQDRFEQRGPGSHSVEIPFHLAISVRAQQHSASEFILTTPTGKSFRVQWSGDSAWGVSIEDAEVSPSYGARVSTQRLMWRSARLTDLTVRISPADETSTSSPP